MITLVNNKRKDTTLLFCLIILVIIYSYANQRHQALAPATSSTNASLALGAEVAIAQATSEWSQLAHDPQRTGYVPIDVPTPWQLKWIWNGPVGSGDAGPSGDHLTLPKGMQPIVGDGRLYVGHSDGQVWAISEATGTQVWSSAIGGEVLNTGAYDSESVYFGSTNGRLYRLRASDGQILEEFNAGGEIAMAPLLVGDTVYIGSTNGTFYALDRTTLTQSWSYDAGASLLASPAYSDNYGGLAIILSEDKFAHAVQVSDGSRRWRVAVNADEDPLRGNTSFADTYPVVSEANDAVIVRSYLDWDKMWRPDGGAPSTVEEIRSYLANNPTLQSFFVLNLDNGAQRFVAPVMVGAIGNGGDFESVPPQAVVKRLIDGTEVAYVLWRTRQACIMSWCDGREDTTVGEMDLGTGNIRFVQDYKNDGTMRMPTDEQSPLSMAGDSLFYAHWMTLGSIRVTDRSSNLGGSYNNPIRTEELIPALNTLASGSCSNRDSSNHYCPQRMYTPEDDYSNDPGFYVYYYNQNVYDQHWRTPIRNAVVSNGSIYWRTVDGAIFALQTETGPSPTNTPTPTPTNTPTPTPTNTPTSTPTNTPTSTPSARKAATPATARTGATISFTITFVGTGKPITVTDELPIQLEYLSSQATCPGTLLYTIYDPDKHQVVHYGTPSAGSACVIQISTQVSTSHTLAVTNTAIIDSETAAYSVSTTVILNGLELYLPLILKQF
jgi:outer membrane protein assembly factor BamB